MALQTFISRLGLSTHFRWFFVHCPYPREMPGWSSKFSPHVWFSLSSDSRGENRRPFTIFNLRASLSIPWVKKPDCRTISFGKCKLLRRNVSLRELQSLLGLLIVTSSVVVPGHTFLRCMIDLTRRTKRPHHRIRLTKEAKCDIQVWLSFLQNFNGKTFFYTEQWDSHSSLELFSDAAGSEGYGAIFGKHWFSERGWIRQKMLILRFEYSNFFPSLSPCEYGVP